MAVNCKSFSLALPKASDQDTKSKMANQDDRGFEKAPMELMDPRKANFQDTGQKREIKKRLRR